MVGWHHQLDGQESEQALGFGDGQGSLVCCTPWGRKESDMTATELTERPYSPRLAPVFIVLRPRPNYSFYFYLARSTDVLWLKYAPQIYPQNKFFEVNKPKVGVPERKRILSHTMQGCGLPRWRSGKEPACKYRRHRRCRLDH